MMNSAPHDVYVDLDDVLAETSRMFLSLLYRRFGRIVHYQNLTSFSLAKSLGLGPDDLDEFIRLAHMPDELMRIKPVTGTQEALQGWRRRGVVISIVTGRPPESSDVTTEWLAKHRIPCNRLLFVDKYGKGYKSCRGLVSLKELGVMRFVMAIEDSLEFGTYLAQSMGISVALRSCPWNSHPVLHPKISRCNTWQDVSDLLIDHIHGPNKDNSRK
jgi:uncharacterized HAD superfamily protein